MQSKEYGEGPEGQTQEKRVNPRQEYDEDQGRGETGPEREEDLLTSRGQSAPAPASASLFVKCRHRHFVGHPGGRYGLPGRHPEPPSPSGAAVWVSLSPYATPPFPWAAMWTHQSPPKPGFHMTAGQFWPSWLRMSPPAVRKPEGQGSWCFRESGGCAGPSPGWDSGDPYRKKIAHNPCPLLPHSGVYSSM